MDTASWATSIGNERGEVVHLEAGRWDDGAKRGKKGQEVGEEKKRGRGQSASGSACATGVLEAKNARRRSAH